MKKLVRLLLILLGLLVLCLAATPLLGAWLLRRYVDKEFLVLQTEKSINARASLDDVTLTLFAWPPSLQLSGVKIAPRDQYAGTPLAGRPPLTNAPVQVAVAYAELEPAELWRRNFVPNVIRFVGVDVKESINPRDGSSLEKLFLPPLPEGAVAAAEPDVPLAIPVQPGQPLQQVSGTPDQQPGQRYYPAQPQPGVAVQPGVAPQSNLPEKPVGEANPSSKASRMALKEIRIEQGRFHITNETSDARFDGEISEFNLSITNIDIDPDDIAHHNNITAQFDSHVVLDGMAQVNGQMQNVRFADMRLSGAGNVNPVDPATMTWAPAAALKLIISRGSTIGGHMTIGDAAGNHLDKLTEKGVDLRGIRIGGPLAQDLSLSVLSKDQMLTFLEDAHLALPDYEFTIKSKSWLNFATDNQGLQTRLHCGAALKEQIIQGVAARGLGETVSRFIVDSFSDDRGHVSFDLTITGSLSHPEVKPDIQLRLESILGGNLEEKAKDLKETAKELKSVGGFLKGLFKKD